MENTTKILLTSQRPLVCVVITDSIKNVCTCLLFENMFLDFTLSISFVKQSLITAAEAHRPRADIICQRILHDKKYFLKIMPLVRSSCLWLTSLILCTAVGPNLPLSAWCERMLQRPLHPGLQCNGFSTWYCWICQGAIVSVHIHIHMCSKSKLCEPLEFDLMLGAVGRVLDAMV